MSSIPPEPYSKQASMSPKKTATMFKQIATLKSLAMSVKKKQQKTQ